MNEGTFAVIGAAGFIGSNLVDRLLYDGHTVWGFDNLSTGIPANLEKKHPKFYPVKADARSIGLQKSKVKGVFNCAAEPRMQWVKENPERTLDANVKLVAHLARQCEKYKKVLVHCSSSSVYGHAHDIDWSDNSGIREDDIHLMPANTYGFQKALAESVINDLSNTTLHASMLRFFNVYGEGQQDDSDYTGVITKFLKLKKEGKPLTIFGDGTQERDFTYVQDVVSAMIQAYEFSSKNPGIHTFNIGSSLPVSVQAIAEAVGGSIEYLQARPGDVQKTKADIEKARKDLGWEPNGDVLSWIKEQ